MNPIKKRDILLKKLIKHPDFIRGSITGVCSTCNRAHCICRKESTKRAYRLTYKDAKQKTRTVYVRREQLPKIRKMIANHANLRKIIEQLVETNIEIFKAEARQ